MNLFKKIILLLTKTEKPGNSKNSKDAKLAENVRNIDDSRKTIDCHRSNKQEGIESDGSEESPADFRSNPNERVETGNSESSKNLPGFGPGSYFQLSRSWADDFYTSTVTSRNRWRAMTLYILLPGTFLLLILMGFLIPTQHLEPLLINHYDDGLVTVVPMQNVHAPKNKAEIESDIVRYVVNRESYSVEGYQEQYSLVNLLSENSIADEYVKAQSSKNKNSPINTLGDKGYRSVQILSVLFLDNVDQNTRDHHNLAQVNFTMINHDKVTGNTQSIPATAIISWEYRDKPRNPEEAWQNWDGFVVTHYEIQQQTVSNE